MPTGSGVVGVSVRPGRAAHGASWAGPRVDSAGLAEVPLEPAPRARGSGQSPDSGQATTSSASSRAREAGATPARVGPGW